MGIARQATRDTDRGGVRRAKVLIADDDAWFADAIASALNGDFDVKVTNTPSECLDVLDAWRPNVLALDVLFGAQNALTLLNEMVSHDDLQGQKVILLTSVAHKIYIDDVRRFGVVRVLDKQNVTPQNLRAEIGTLCGNAKSVKGEAKDD